MRNLSLSTKITLLTLVGAALLSGINAFNFQKIDQRLRSQITEELNSWRGTLASAISAQVYERYGDVQAFGLNEVLLSGNTQNITSALNAYIATYGIYDLILVLSLDGSLIAVNDRDPKGNKIDVTPLYSKNFSSELWHQKVIEGKTIDDVEKGFAGTYISDPQNLKIFNWVYKKDGWHNVFSAAVKDKAGKPVAVLANFANFRWVYDEFNTFMRTHSTNGAASANFSLVGSDGSILWETATSSSASNTGILDLKSLENTNLVEKGVEAVALSISGKEGIVEGEHFRSGQREVISYGKIVGPKFPSGMEWSLLVSRPVSTLLGSLERDVRLFYLSLFFGLALVGLVSVLFSRAMGRNLSTFSRQLETILDESKKMGLSLTQSSGDLAASSTEQASAIQESVSALNEMSSMLNQTSENSKKSQETAREVSEKSKSGTATVKKMVHSMNSISEASKNLEAIAQAIHQIKDKTSMINAIVFKTQLLSFNASIEAARAGQYGKGFAVVAEEVGNLAQMSGAASGEIETLIGKSQQQVDGTLELIQSRVQDGQTVSAEVATTFAEIASSIEGISAQITSIAEASHQQDVGIQQSQKAMEQLDIAARKNSEAAASTQTASVNLGKQDIILGGIVSKLNEVVLGQGREKPTEKFRRWIRSKGAGSKMAEVIELPLPKSGESIHADDDSFKHVA